MSSRVRVGVGIRVRVRVRVRVDYFSMRFLESLPLCLCGLVGLVLD